MAERLQLQRSCLNAALTNQITENNDDVVVLMQWDLPKWKVRYTTFPPQALRVVLIDTTPIFFCIYNTV